MSTLRPKNLNLFSIHFPLPAIISILHRITGVVLFCALPCLFYIWQISLTPKGFDLISAYWSMPLTRFIFWLCLIPFCGHFVAGIRHLLSDIHVGDTGTGGRISAVVTFMLVGFLIAVIGIWLW